MDARTQATPDLAQAGGKVSTAWAESHATPERWRLPIPKYLADVYTWAYVSPKANWTFDRQWVVSQILWYQDRALMRSALSEVRQGDRVYMPASVYGILCRDLSLKAGPTGQVTISDIAWGQLRILKRKRKRFGLSNLHIFRANAAAPIPGPYDTVLCFLLLHEIPEDYKVEIINALLDQVDEGGKVVFIEYHKMKKWNPLWPIMAFVAWSLEPYTFALWHNEITDYATPDRREKFTWTKTVTFGGLYQKVVGVRKKA